MAKPANLPPSGGLGRGYLLVGSGLPIGWGGASSYFFTNFLPSFMYSPLGSCVASVPT